MRRAWLALLALAGLSGGPALGQTVTDVGEVVVDAGVNLSVGVDGSGSRTVDAADDGPYTSVSLGVNPGASGALSLIGGSTFGTPGVLGIGVGGEGLVEVRGGSRLESGSSRLASVPAGPVFDSSRAVVSGEGSTWSNAGALEFVGIGGSVQLLEGGRLFSEGVSSALNDQARYRHEILVDGAGSLLHNSGALSLIVERTTADFVPKIAVSNGGRMIDTGAVIRNFGPSSAPAVRIAGPGSHWESGPNELVASGLRIESGGAVQAESLSLQVRENISTGVVTGAGSLLDLSGPLSLSGDLPTSFVIDAGGSVRSVGAAIRSSGGMRVAGAGSTWTNAGDLELSLFGDLPSSGFLVTGGARVFNQDAAYLRCDPAFSPECRGIEIADPGSLWRSAGDVSLNGPTLVRDGGVLSVGNRLEVLGGTLPGDALRLDAGRIEADSLVVDDGLLAGAGEVVGDVSNSGTVDPGDSGTGTPGVLAIAGTYSQDGTGVLEILLTGSAVHQLGRVAVTGTAALAGELAIRVGAGFETEIGDRFTVLEYGARTGEFDQITGLQLGDGLSLKPVYADEELFLTTVPEPSAAWLLGAGLLAIAATRRR
jgi:T5SS/PEP-CTERM-associated repeat protein